MLEVFGLSNGAVHGKVICIARKELHHLVHPESVKQGLEKSPVRKANSVGESLQPCLMPVVVSTCAVLPWDLTL